MKINIELSRREMIKILDHGSFKLDVTQFELKYILNDVGSLDYVLQYEEKEE